MKIIAWAFQQWMESSIEAPMPSIIARGHADGNQGDWRLVAELGEVIGRPPPELLLIEPRDSPILKVGK